MLFKLILIIESHKAEKENAFASVEEGGKKKKKNCDREVGIFFQFFKD